MKYSQDDGRQGVSAWNDPRWRALFFQAVLVLVAGVLVYDLAVNTARNLANRNIASGWDFLTRNSGFDVVFSLIAYSSESNYGRALLVGFLNTLLVSAMGIVLATVLGFAVGVMRLSRNWLAARAASIFVEFLRNTPLLLQLFIWYALVLKPLPDARNAIRIWDIGALSNKGLTLPMPIFGPGAWMALLGLGLAAAGSLIIHRWARKRQAETGERFASGLVTLALVIALPVLFFAIAGWPVTFDYPVMGSFSFRGGATLVPEFMALLLGLSVYTAAFIAEAVRAGIQAIPRGQSEAAHALGLAPGPIMRLVILPQALRVIIPPMTNQYLNLTKNSSLAVAIGYPDVVSISNTAINQTGRAVECIAIVMLVYLTTSLSTSTFMNWYNKRSAIKER